MDRDRSRTGLASGIAVLALTWFCHAAVQAEPDAQRGIAARHPRDAGIAGDPAVLFAEDFEATPLQKVLDRWEDVASPGLVSASDDVPPGSAGRRSLRLHKLPGDGARSAGLYRRIQNADGRGHRQLYARMYVKIAADSAPIHHFGASLGGHHPSTRWPQVSAGKRPSGDASLWTSVEPYGDVWRWDFYTYWMEMRSFQHDDGTGDAAYGNAFLREGAAGGWAPAGPPVRRGEWVCLELMVKLNDPVGARNGEQAFWIDGQPVRKDGQIVSHLGPGSPRGSWLRDKWIPDPNGQPFEGFRWRSAPELLLDFVWLYIYTEQDDHDIAVQFDDLVVATSYIGPLAPR